MRDHVYIALDRFKAIPISPDAWLAAARQCADLIVVEEKSLNGTIRHSVMLEGDKSARLDLGPDGLVCARNPSRELIVAMFKLSGLLDANVYSERLNRYRSVEDWERRNKRRAKYRKNRRLSIDLGIIFVVLFAVLVWLVVAITFRVI